MNIDYPFKSIEDLLRYIAPGFTAIMIAAFCGLVTKEQYETEHVWIMLPFLGIAWYATHRTVLYLLDYVLYHMIPDGSVQKSYTANMAPDGKTSRNYLYNRLASIHLSMIVAQQCLVFCWFATTNKWVVFGGGLFLLIISLISYFMTLIEDTKYNNTQGIGTGK